MTEKKKKRHVEKHKQMIRVALKDNMMDSEHVATVEDVTRRTNYF